MDGLGVLQAHAVQEVSLSLSLVYVVLLFTNLSLSNFYTFLWLGYSAPMFSKFSFPSFSLRFCYVVDVEMRVLTSKVITTML